MKCVDNITGRKGSKFERGIIGKILELDDGALVYVTERKPEHYFIKYTGFALSVDLIERLNDKCVEEVLFIYNGFNGTILYIIDLYDFVAKGQETNYNDEDIQIACSTEHMLNVPIESEVQKISLGII
jgi:hypothetical protein